MEQTVKDPTKNGTRPSGCGCAVPHTLCRVTELVWDAEAIGTAVAQDGRTLRVGGGEWSPEELLSLATEVALMTTFLALAERAKIDVLGYLSSAHLIGPEDSAEPCEVVVAPCIVVRSEEHAAIAERLAADAFEQSSVGRLFGDRVRVEPRITVLPRAPELDLNARDVT